MIEAVSFKQTVKLSGKLRFDGHFSTRYIFINKQEIKKVQESKNVTARGGTEFQVNHGVLAYSACEGSLGSLNPEVVFDSSLLDEQKRLNVVHICG